MHPSNQFLQAFQTISKHGFIQPIYPANLPETLNLWIARSTSHIHVLSIQETCNAKNGLT
jgi:hypothetical protein